MNAVSEVPPMAATPKKRRRWWQIALAALGAIVVVSVLSRGGSPKLKVSTSEAGAGFKQLQVLNADDKAITITSLKINDRDECAPRSLPQEIEPFQSIKLQIGESAGWFTVCRVVRATFKTSAGSASFEFR
jgi:hypothetical protein